MNSKENYFSKILAFLLVFISIVIISVTGYMRLENWDFFDALYMTIITLATIGYGETHELSFGGRIHTIFIIFIGVGFFSSMILYISGLLLDNDFRNYLILKSRLRKINKLEDHYVVCGYGRIGREVCEELRFKNIKNIIIIDKSDKILREASEHGFLVFNGDATKDEDLISVGIKKASCIICALTDDALNVFITLSARVLNPNIRIISRADHVDSIDKLKRAGADTVVAPYVIGGRRIASAITHPSVLDFLDTVLHNHEYDLNIEEISINFSSKLDGITIGSSNIRAVSGAVIISVKQQDGSFISNPNPEYILKSSDKLLALGNKEQLSSLSKMAL